MAITINKSTVAAESIAAKVRHQRLLTAKHTPVRRIAKHSSAEVASPQDV